MVLCHLTASVDTVTVMTVIIVKGTEMIEKDIKDNPIITQNILTDLTVETTGERIMAMILR